MEKNKTFYPQKFESKKHYSHKAFQIVYSYREYSSCMEIFAPVFRWYLKTLPPFEVKFSQVNLIVYLHLYRIKTIKRFQKPKVYFAFKGKRCNIYLTGFNSMPTLVTMIVTFHPPDGRMKGYDHRNYVYMYANISSDYSNKYTRVRLFHWLHKYQVLKFFIIRSF